MNNKCVYVHKLNGEVVYVGSGAKKRYNNKSCRSPQHLEVWDDLQFEIVESNLSITEAVNIEQQLINKYLSTGELFNVKNKVDIVKNLNFEELSKELYYDETSPTYLRRKLSKYKFKAGDVAGSIGGHGYFVVRVNGERYRVNRVVFVLATKEDIPHNMVVDHIDGNKANNAISNLRAVTQSVNQSNKSHIKSNTGYQNITEYVKKKHFVLQSRVRNASICFSYTDKPVKKSKNHYPTRELALEAALLVRDMLVDSGEITVTNKEEL